MGTGMVSPGAHQQATHGQTCTVMGSVAGFASADGTSLSMVLRLNNFVCPFAHRVHSSNKPYVVVRLHREDTSGAASQRWCASPSVRIKCSNHKCKCHTPRCLVLPAKLHGMFEGLVHSVVAGQPNACVPSKKSMT